MKRNQRGFTLMELMVVIVIVAILAAVAVPLYINYVKDAQRTEAKGAIGAIISAEQVYFQKSNGKYLQALSDNSAQGFMDALNVDLTDTMVNWTFTLTDGGKAAETGFEIKAVGVTGKQSEKLEVTYTHDRTGGGQWTDEGAGSGSTGGGGTGTPP